MSLEIKCYQSSKVFYLSRQCGKTKGRMPRSMHTKIQYAIISSLEDGCTLHKSIAYIIQIKELIKEKIPVERFVVFLIGSLTVGTLLIRLWRFAEGRRHFSHSACYDYIGTLRTVISQMIIHQGQGLSCCPFEFDLIFI
jgi:hypothetical protein